MNEALRSEADYQAFYCEENVWRLVQSAELGPGARVAFISNPDHRVAFWSQAAGRPQDDGLVVWDYHVVAWADGRVFDLDSTLPFGVDAQDYLRATFRRAPPAFAPRFRLIDAGVYAEGLGSDRSHMRDEAGAFRAPPPAWTPPGGDALPLASLLSPADLPRCPWQELAAVRTLWTPHA